MKRFVALFALVFFSSVAFGDRVQTPLIIGTKSTGVKKLEWENGTTATNPKIESDTSNELDIYVNSLLKISSSSTTPTVALDTADASDSKRLILAGGGTGAATRGAWITLSGNEATVPGAVTMTAGSGVTGTTGSAIIATTNGQASAMVIRDDGMTTFSDRVNSPEFMLTGTTGTVTTDSLDNSDTKGLYLLSAGDTASPSHTRGAYHIMYGNEFTSVGGRHVFQTGSGSNATGSNVAFSVSGSDTVGNQSTGSIFQLTGDGTAARFASWPNSDMSVAARSVSSTYQSAFDVYQSTSNRGGIKALASGSGAAIAAGDLGIVSVGNMIFSVNGGTSAIATITSAGLFSFLSDFQLNSGGYQSVFSHNGTGAKWATNSAARDIRIVANTGGVVLAAAATAWAAISDERMKRDIKPINLGLATILKLKPKLFNYKTDKEEQAPRLGFVAQDVEKVIPQLVNADEAGIKNLAMEPMIPVLVKAIQELKAEFDAYKKAHP